MVILKLIIKLKPLKKKKIISDRINIIISKKHEKKLAEIGYKRKESICIPYSLIPRIKEPYLDIAFIKYNQK